jgi:hypothetical protein
MDVFLGPFCEDSRRMWPVLKALSSQTVGSTAVRVHIFPLSYNLGSFLPAQACVASSILSNRSETAVTCLDIVYAGDNQKRIKTAAMVNATTPQVIESLVTLLAAPLGVSRTALQAELAQGLESGARSYGRTKSDWKYGCSRGVFATPSVFLNGVQLHGYDASGSHGEGDLAALAVSDWMTVLHRAAAGA